MLTLIAIISILVVMIIVILSPSKTTSRTSEYKINPSNTAPFYGESQNNTIEQSEASTNETVEVVLNSSQAQLLKLHKDSQVRITEHLNKVNIDINNHWLDNYEIFYKTVVKHRNEIDIQLKKAMNTTQFYSYINLHYNSFQVADRTYQLLSDARDTLTNIKNMLLSTKKAKDQLKQKLNEKGKNRTKIFEEINFINSQREPLFHDQELIKSFVNSLADEVNKLNEQTMVLKFKIRDECGIKGEEWYKKLINRIEQKRRG